jgi:carboxymethylenebutenolidase
MSDINEATSMHLSAKPIALGDNVTLQPPLSRRGTGPGLLVLLPEYYRDQSTSSSTKTLDPEPQQKWAEEGFAVVQVKVKDAVVAKQRCDIGIRALNQRPECATFSHIGVIGWSLCSIPCR